MLFLSPLSVVFFSTQINGMTKELDALLESIEVEGGFRDVCTIYQNGSVKALEQGMNTLSDQCRTWKVMLYNLFTQLLCHFLQTCCSFEFFI